MSIRSTLIVAAAFATLGAQVGPAFADGGYSPGPHIKSRPTTACRMASGTWDARTTTTPTQQCNKMTGGGADRITKNQRGCNNRGCGHDLSA